MKKTIITYQVELTEMIRKLNKDEFSNRTFILFIHFYWACVMIWLQNQTVTKENYMRHIDDNNQKG